MALVKNKIVAVILQIVIGVFFIGLLSHLIDVAEFTGTTFHVMSAVKILSALVLLLICVLLVLKD
jgi:hypothetical protein